MPATLATRSGCVRYAVTGVRSSSPSSTTSLKEKGTDTMRPSNSGMATAIETSIGPSPASLEAHASWDTVAATACTTGTSSSTRAVASH